MCCWEGPLFVTQSDTKEAYATVERCRIVRRCECRELDSHVMNNQDIITIEPGKRGGQPCIRGMRITVYDVLSYLASGMTEQEVLSDFPELTHGLAHIL